MAEATPFLAAKRYAVVTGANKGIGMELCRQLSSKGILVILTSRDEKRGLNAVESIKKSGISADNIEFHQLDVTDQSSVSSFADFMKDKFGKLDILVNNAGILGATADFDVLFAAGFPKVEKLSLDVVTQTNEQARECIETNYYGVKRCTQALLPLLNLSDSPRIINVSSASGLLSLIRNEGIRGVLDNAEELTEEVLDEILNDFLTYFEKGTCAEKGWMPVLSAYFASKAVLNAYTRILAKQNPAVIINCLCPGYVKTDINENSSCLTVEEGGSRVVRLVLACHGAPSGLFYTNNQVTPFGLDHSTPFKELFIVK